MSTRALTAETFIDGIRADGIVFVDFWASWCGPCRAFAPIFEAASARHPDITWAKVDTEAQPALAAALEIRSIPTLMVFRDGVLVFAQPGLVSGRRPRRARRRGPFARHDGGPPRIRTPRRRLSRLFWSGSPLMSERDDPRAQIEFSYWSDPLCIWALVAQPKLDRLLTELGRQLAVDYRIVPVFGSVPWRFAQGPWAKEGVDGRVAATRRVAMSAGRADVSGECWRRAAPASSWAPAMIIKAVFALEKLGDVACGSGACYQRALREAFFVAEENVARRDVQLRIAEAEGLARAPIERQLDDGTALAAVWEDHTEKERLRIQGSPTYVFDGGRAMLYGNFEYGMLRSTVEELVRGIHPGSSAC